MDIKVKFALIGALSLATVLVFGGGLFFFTRQFGLHETRRGYADDVVFAVFERNLFFNDYLATQSKRTGEQLIAANKNIGELLERSSGIFLESNEQEKVKRMKENHASISSKLNVLQELKKNGEGQEIKQRLTSQILAESQDTATIAQNLSEEEGRKMTNLNRWISNTALLFSVAGIALAAFSTFIGLAILRAINTLREGAEMISKGNLKHRVHVKTRDEIGDLAASFNAMTESMVKARRLPENILRSVKDLLFVVDTEGNITEANEAALETLGYAKTELIGNPISKVFGVASSVSAPEAEHGKVGKPEKKR
jgi:nitrogen fixation/metabolism regulation signal transduction histidine kinase